MEQCGHNINRVIDAGTRRCPMSATATKFRKALSANSTSTTDLTAKLPTATKPSGSGVFDLLDLDLGLSLGVNTPSYVELVPYGAGAATMNNKDFHMQLWGWTATNDATPIYIPRLLAHLVVTCGDILATAIAANTY